MSDFLKIPYVMEKKSFEHGKKLEKSKISKLSYPGAKKQSYERQTF